MTLGEVDIEKAIELGIINTPQPYSEGSYNTIYNSVSSNELSIFEAKVRRHNPEIRGLVEGLIANSKGTKLPMTDNDLK